MPSVTLSSAHSKKPSRLEGVGRTLARLTLVSSALSFIVALLVVTTETHALTAPILEKLNIARNVAWGPTAQQSIGLIVGSVILTALGLLGVIFVVLLTYGGFLWLTSAGEEDKAKKARDLIVNSLIGIFIVIAAYSIGYFVLSRLSEAVVT
ncbi:hypothetical protein HY623_03290 [Candidatus Uhrbacteria bacterium]|nr:hypothetical protein [Candidatus Uhrbacteria bacterium]